MVTTSILCILRILVNSSRHPAGDALMQRVRSYLQHDDVAFVERALDFAAECHEGQPRDSGEPYIVHPIGVTDELAKLKLPADVLAAGLLHDTVEDTGVTVEQLEEYFGKSVARMVDGVTKLDEIDLRLDEQPQAGRTKRRHADRRERRRVASLRKMFATAGEDFRVLLIKLADRTNNMETLKFKKNKQSRGKTARETIEVYAPLAERLGMYDIKWRLEDLSFQHLDPEAYATMKRLVNQKRDQREEYAKRAVEMLTDAVVNKAGIHATISGRAKHLYSIYQKKKRYEAQGRSFDDIHDLIALRVIVDDEQACYAALGVVHGLWEAMPGGYDDYISRPKMNGYKSIHTNLMGPNRQPLEVQIRSWAMHRFAEEGVAAHWAYKDGEPNDESADVYVRTMERLKEFLGIEGTGGDPAEFIDTVREEILDTDLVQVFTPAGEIIELPYGATPLDFAYRIHTQLGHEASGAIVNNKMVGFDTRLEQGDVIRINRTSGKAPSLDWRDPRNGFLVTKSALAKVRQWYSRQNREASLQAGRVQMKKVINELKRMGYKCKPEQVAEGAGYESTEAVLIDLGTSQAVVSTVVDAVVDAIDEDQRKSVPKPTIEIDTTSAPPPDAHRTEHGIVVMGQTNSRINIPKCCSIVYGDEIIGYITRGRGITAHHVSCPNIVYASDPNLIIDLAWGHTNTQRPVRIRVEGSDRVGLVYEITGILNSANKNMHAMSTGERANPGKSVVTFTIYVDSVHELSQLFSRFDRLKGVDNVSRISENSQG